MAVSHEHLPQPSADQEHPVAAAPQPDGSHERVPHSGNLPLEEGGERPAREFDNTPLLQAVQEGLVRIPGAGEPSERVKSPAKKWIAGTVGAVVLAGGGYAVAKATSGHEGASQPGTSTTESAPTGHGNGGIVTDPETGTSSIAITSERTATSEPSGIEGDADAFNKLDPHVTEFVKFKPVDLDGSSPEALLASFQYNMNCVINDIRPEVVDACIEKLTGSNAPSDPGMTQNAEVLHQIAKNLADYRLGSRFYKEKDTYTLTGSTVNGNVTVLNYKLHTEDTTGVVEDRDASFSFTKTAQGVFVEPGTIVATGK